MNICSVVHTAQLLVFASQSIALVLGLVQVVVQTNEFGLLVADLALSSLIQLDGLLQASLDLDVGAFEHIDALLKLASSVVGTLQVDDEHLDFALQAALLFLQVVDFDQQRFDMLLLLLDASAVFATELLDLLGTGGGLSIGFGVPLLSFGCV